MTDAARPEAVREMFARIRDRYDLLNRLLSFGLDAGWRRRLAARVAEGHPRRVLDLATGTGDVWLAMHRVRAAGALVCGADFCLPLLGLARRKGAAPLVAADALKLPFCDGAFDAVTIAFGLRNFERRGTALRECARVLAPGGTLWVLEFTPPPRALAWLYFFHVGRLGPRLARAAGSDPEAYRYLGESIRRFPGPDALAAEMAGAGFTAVAVERLALGTVALHSGRCPGPASGLPPAACP